MKKKIYGTIVCEGTLKNLRAKLVRRNIGGFLVRLVSDRGAWVSGDLVQVSTGEFKQETRYYLVTFRDKSVTTVIAVSPGEARSKAINWYRSVHNTGCPIVSVKETK